MKDGSAPVPASPHPFDSHSSPSLPNQGAHVVALVGNPNTGKTALFNALTGFRRHVANYAGVTVDIARGPVRTAVQPIDLLDLPGTYSLAAASPDEMILCKALCGHVSGQPRPSVILAIVDASNPQRNLYLVSQLLELGLPVVVALNMMDIADARGIDVDVERLSRELGVPVVPTVATQRATVRPLVSVLEAAISSPPPQPPVELPEAIENAVAQMRRADTNLRRGEALRLLIDRDGHAESQYLQLGGQAEVVRGARERLAESGVDPGPMEIRARYMWVNRVLQQSLVRRVVPAANWTNRLDRVLTHRLGGGIALILVLYAMFYAIYSGADPLMGSIEGVFATLSAAVSGVLPAGMFRSLVADGIIAGVGGVLVFLPQILLLFLFIAVLEDCGYLARAAFMVDRLMRPLGLSGRAFIPLLSSFACAVPAIMGTRAISNRRERMITILIIPFMSCSARLPVYLLLIGAFVPHRAWAGGWLRLDALVMLALYVLGIVVAIPIAVLLRRAVFTGPPPDFLMELPSYKAPKPRTVYQRVYLAGRDFIVRAGTTILVVNLIVWALGYFPRSDSTRNSIVEAQTTHGWSDERFEAELAGAYLRNSYLGHIGHAIEPAIRPLGWDWRIGVGVVAAFPAREIVIATMGTVFNLGQGDEATTVGLREALPKMTWEGTDRKLFTLPVALSLMVFFALCAQCSATLVMIGRETGTWLWAGASFVGMTTLAYVAAMITYHSATWVGL